MSRAPGRRPANSAATLNAFTRLFKKISSPQTSFLNACLLETHFRDIRISALKALRSAQSRKYGVHVPLYEISRLCAMSLEECYEFCVACGLTMSTTTNLEECTVELHKHAPFDDKSATLRTRKSAFVTAKAANLSIVDLIDNITNPTTTASIAHTILPAPTPKKTIQFPPATSNASPLCSSKLPAIPLAPKSLAVDRAAISPLKSTTTFPVNPIIPSASSRSQQTLSQSHKPAEHGLVRERTKRSASLKTFPGSSSLSSFTESTLKTPKSKPTAPTSTQKLAKVARGECPPSLCYGQAVAHLRAEILSNIVESFISQAAQTTIMKKHSQASAEEKRMNQRVVSHFCDSLGKIMLCEVAHSVVFDLASSSVLAIYHRKKQDLLLKAAFRKWKDTLSRRKSGLKWKRFNLFGAQNFKVTDMSAIWTPGNLQNVVTQYLYRKLLSKLHLSILDIRALIIVPMEAPVVQAWLRCKFGLEADQNYIQCSINATMVSIEFMDRSIDFLAEDISRYALIMVWQDPANQSYPSSLRSIKAGEVPLADSVCCLGISWHPQKSDELEEPFGKGGFYQVQLSLDMPEIELEQALHERWPVPTTDIVTSMNNADNLAPLMDLWRRSQRKARTLMNVYVPRDDLLTPEANSRLKTSLLKYCLNSLNVIVEYARKMLYPPDDGLAPHTAKTLHTNLLSNLKWDTIDQQLIAYQASLPLNTFSLNLSYLCDSHMQLSSKLFELFGQHLFTAWLDCLESYLRLPLENQTYIPNKNYSESNQLGRVLLHPNQLSAGPNAHCQVRNKLNSVFGGLQNEITALFPRPLVMAYSPDPQIDRHEREEETVSDDHSQNSKKRKSDKLAELRLLVHQTREDLG